VITIFSIYLLGAAIVAVLSYNSCVGIGRSKFNSLDVFLIMGSWLVVFAVIYIWLKGDTK
jgi:hypothetical protein